jgi:hypothetical protein
LERHQHAAEVLAHKLIDQRLSSEALVDSLLLADRVDELGAGLEGELLREDERVVAVKEEGGDLRTAVSGGEILESMASCATIIGDLFQASSGELTTSAAARGLR